MFTSYIAAPLLLIRTDTNNTHTHTNDNTDSKVCGREGSGAAWRALSPPAMTTGPMLVEVQDL